MGFSTICLSFVFLTMNFLYKPFWNGIASPLIIMSLVYLFIGYKIVAVNSKKEKEWANLTPTNHSDFLSTEFKRIKKTEAKFKPLSNVFMMLMLLSTIFILLGFGTKLGAFSIGTGLGLLAPSAVIYLTNQYRAFNVGMHINFLNSRSK